MARSPVAGHTRDQAFRALTELARDQGGVVSRLQAYGVGFTRGQLRAQVRARRWKRIGSQSLALTTGRE